MVERRAYTSRFRQRHKGASDEALSCIIPYPNNLRAVTCAQFIKLSLLEKVATRKRHVCGTKGVIWFNGIILHYHACLTSNCKCRKSRALHAYTPRNNIHTKDTNCSKFLKTLKGNLTGTEKHLVREMVSMLT